MLHLYNREYELDVLALQKAKIRYLKLTRPDSLSTLSDSLIRVQALSIPNTDSAFYHYLKEVTPGFDSTASMPENVRRIYGTEKLEAEMDTILSKQKALVSQYLTEEKGIPGHAFYHPGPVGRRRSH